MPDRLFARRLLVDCLQRQRDLDEFLVGSGQISPSAMAFFAVNVNCDLGWHCKHIERQLYPLLVSVWSIVIGQYAGYTLGRLPE